VLVHGPEHLVGLRVVAKPAVLEATNWPTAATVLRIAADDVFVINVATIEVADEHAIIEPETAFVGWELSPAEFEHHFHHHLEWQIPPQRPVFVQGLAAAVPMKALVQEDNVLVLCTAAQAHELAERCHLPHAPKAGAR
jgi:hypothetical protein